ncbi:PGN_0703 family putative restriction endonuclease, partial [Sphingomonas azotifigens]|uniref:PGN_0703 family putative restriction endonuclease n=1 Tax=Sphingomonas azotifigens TaxID=330920 RepID=UPI00350E3CD2
MKVELRAPDAPLPIVPAEVLKRFHVHERHDSRLRACARLLQALWLSDRCIPIGFHRSRRGRRRLGSRLSVAAAVAGRNFLSPEIANLAHQVMAYREHGALLDAERVLGNALGSTATCLNFMGPLALDLNLATRVLRRLLPDLGIDRVDSIRFEHSPGRLDPTLTADRSAFDACAFVKLGGRPGRPARSCVLALEFKYTESLHDSAPCPPGRYDDLAEASGLFQESSHQSLRMNPLQQLFREHLLAQAAVMRGDWPDALFISVAPAVHLQAGRQAEHYGSFLKPAVKGQ